MSEEMTRAEWFLLIFSSDLAAAFLFALGSLLLSRLRNRRLDLGCEFCQEPKPLAKTPDGQHYLCRGCYPAYVRENFPDLEPNLKKIFRKRVKRRT